jgi:S-(hydroxymethyl)glutathione dehydrogenase / alcohol dehydrogenase
MQIRAAVMHAPHQPLAIETLEIAEPGPGELLIRLFHTGICHSDLTFLDGHGPGFALPIVLGHEGAGIVERCGDGVAGFAPGDHVLPMCLGTCGRCDGCRSQRTNICDTTYASMVAQGALDGSTRLALGDRPVFQMGGVGTFATHTVVAVEKVAKIRADAPLDRACLVSCAVSTGVGAAIFDGDITPGDSVAVFGLGGIGLNVVQGARLAGATRIIGVDLDTKREAIGRHFGLTDFVDAGSSDPVEAIKAIVPGGVDRAFEAVGSERVVAQAVAATRAGWGRTVILGVPTGPTVSIGHYDLLNGRTVAGSMQGGSYPLRDCPRMVDWYMAGRLDLDALVTHRLPLDRINDGIAMMRTGEAIRVVIDL